MNGPDLDSAREEIAREIAQVHEESYGQGVNEVQVDIQPTFVVVVMNIELSAAEVTLIGAGNEESVRITREAYQDAIAPTFKALVERATGRRVESFASRTVLDRAAPWSVEVFRLEPPAG